MAILEDRTATSRDREGMFENGPQSPSGCRRCWVSGAEIRVWGAESARGIPRDIVNGVRWIVRRIGTGHPIALMADHHPAEPGVIGSVAVSSAALVPELIGGDCGCGVFAARLPVTVAELELAELQELYRHLERRIPVGTGQRRSEDYPLTVPDDLWDSLGESPALAPRDIRRLRLQLGTLGGGNHFVELAADDEGAIWLLIHSGSRYLGGLIRTHYNGRALPLGSQDADRFLALHHSALLFAALSRRAMAEEALAALHDLHPATDWRLVDEIDLPHNFVELRDDLAVHRKGACKADPGLRGIIPGSMGTYSYLVEGRGAPASYWSSSHGAGRRLSRGDAFRSISPARLRREMQRMVWSGSDRLRDESPSAYKDIDAVMRAQRELVAVTHRLRPLLSLKGDC